MFKSSMFSTSLLKKNIFSYRKIRSKMGLAKGRGINYWVIISAAGLGSRMKSKIPKQYLYLERETILKRSIYNFLQLREIKKIIVTVDSEDYYWRKCRILHNKVAVTTGGETRSASISSGLKSLRNVAHDRDWVLIHDAVRPCINRFFINNLFLLTLKEEVGGLPIVPIFDTIKSSQNKSLSGTVSRGNLYMSQTPQIFRYGVIKRGIESAVRSNIEITDESNILELIAEAPKATSGDRGNIKITSYEDIKYASRVFS